MQDVHLASLDRPELAIETDDIESVRAEARQRAPVRLHPNASTVRLGREGVRGARRPHRLRAVPAVVARWRTVAR